MGQGLAGATARQEARPPDVFTARLLGRDQSIDTASRWITFVTLFMEPSTYEASFQGLANR